MEFIFLDSLSNFLFTKSLGSEKNNQNYLKCFFKNIQQVLKIFYILEKILNSIEF